MGEEREGLEMSMETHGHNPDAIDVEEGPLEEEEKATLTMESPPVVPAEPISIRSSPGEIVDRISQAESVDELKELTKLFHLSLAKKEASRALTQSELVDLLLQQAKERITLRPDSLSNKDVLDYMNAMQTAIDKSSKSLEDNIVEAPPISLNQTNQEININIGSGKSVSIDEDSRSRILDVISAITRGRAQQDRTIGEASQEVLVATKGSTGEPRGDNDDKTGN